MLALSCVWLVYYAPTLTFTCPCNTPLADLKASFYNPESPGETIAIFTLPAEGAATVADLGSPE
eukprot:scaffold164872_cov47-Prasinocladus_malaysianus.AAC.1